MFNHCDNDAMLRNVSYLNASGEIVILTKPEFIGHFEGQQFPLLFRATKLGKLGCLNLRQGWEYDHPLWRYFPNDGTHAYLSNAQKPQTLLTFHCTDLFIGIRNPL